MKTWLGTHPHMNMFTLGEIRKGRVEIDISEEDLNRYQTVLLEYKQIYQELYNLYLAALNNQGTSTFHQKV